MSATPTSMKAVRIHAYGSPEQLQYEEDVACPTPNEGDTLIHVLAAGSEIFPLAEAARAHARLEAGHLRGKIVLQVT
ncbi:MAG: zinc-binding dehydrogenase [Vicinamibacterales bacterium]